MWCVKIFVFLVHFVSSYTSEIGKLPQRLIPFEKSFGARNFRFATFCSLFFYLKQHIVKIRTRFRDWSWVRVDLIGFNHESQRSCQRNGQCTRCFGRPNTMICMHNGRQVQLLKCHWVQTQKLRIALTMDLMWVHGFHHLWSVHCRRDDPKVHSVRHWTKAFVKFQSKLNMR